MKILFIFVDGLGLRAPANDNPVRPEICPTLFDFITSESVPLDACLGVSGLPQSATGQASLYTGKNAAQLMGRHMEGFPGPSLRSLINDTNIFLSLRSLGRSCRFADGYAADSIETIRNRPLKSVTTVMALTCPEVICLKQNLLANQAVTHDITRAILRERGYTGPLITPEQAADHLIQIALAYDFTLFEFFLTDFAGHSQRIEQAEAILACLDAFLKPLIQWAYETGLLLVLTSDHGNIENMGHRSHTTNPVPLAARGTGSDFIKTNVTSLLDVTPKILQLMA